MRELSEFLNERELYVLEHHPAMSYKAIGEEFGVGPERVRQIKVYAERKVREEKRREQAAIRGRQPVSLTLQRRDLLLIIRSLRTHQSDLRRMDLRRKPVPESERDPDIQRTEELIEKLNEILNL